MNAPDTLTVPAPSPRRLAVTTAIALAAALVILVTIVLPAEYAVDPLGTGRWLGLTDIATPPLDPVADIRPVGAPLIPVVNGPVGEYPADFKLDVYDVTLQPYEYVEYKYHLERGATMLYAWQASAPVVQDFHGERAAETPGGEPVEESFDKRDRRQGSGSFAAPFTGIHGWYWENPTEAPVTIRLTTSGFYGSAVEIRSDRSRHARPLTDIEVLPAPPVEPRTDDLPDPTSGEGR
jgi:hypothetical protein